MRSRDVYCATGTFFSRARAREKKRRKRGCEGINSRVADDGCRRARVNSRNANWMCPVGGEERMRGIEGDIGCVGAEV